jgi:hypothetical protein
MVKSTQRIFQDLKMFINKIDINTNTIKRNKNQLSFKAGKVDFYSDFDHTYFPSSQSGIRSAKPEDYPGLVKYFESFKRFFNNTREGLKFHLTSGRTFGEFETISYQTKESGFQMPLPDTFIAKNGSDEYVRVSSDDEFYRDGKFPFRYDATNKEKEEALRAETGWDGPKIKAKLREILKEHDFEIVENDTGNSVGDYGYRSFFDSMLKRDNFPLNSNTMPERSAPIAALRNDGNLKIYLSFPYDTLHVPERESTIKISQVYSWI